MNLLAALLCASAAAQTPPTSCKGIAGLDQLISAGLALSSLFAFAAAPEDPIPEPEPTARRGGLSVRWRTWFPFNCPRGVWTFNGRVALYHGLPGLNHPDFEMVPLEGEEDWAGARVPTEWMLELLRTPTYSTWQGERL